ncbi:MAG: GPW/gp25 family protein [Flavobacteriaceae bacterium]
MYEKFDFLGKGWGFPPHFDKKTGTVTTTADLEDINKSLHILLSTRLGERIMVPNYGCNLEELLFQPLDVTLKTYIKDLIKTAILYHEPRIDAQKITLDDSMELEGIIYIEIEYIVRITNSRGNMVFPFYKKEGTEL